LTGAKAVWQNGGGVIEMQIKGKARITERVGSVESELKQIKYRLQILVVGVLGVFVASVLFRLK